jgi:hypothetical protein
MKIAYLLSQTIPPIKSPVSLIPADPGRTGEFLGKFISNLAVMLLILASIWVLFQLLQGGLEWIGSGGDKTGLDNARNRITNAIIGLIIVFASWAVYLMLMQFLGIPTLGEGGINFQLPSLF